jgi:hydroxyisourate hydrolase
MITTHVLDTSLGRPARAVPVWLDVLEGKEWREIGTGVTDDDGRLRTLTKPGAVANGRYRIGFDTGTYFKTAGVTGFFPVVEIQFDIIDGNAHYHVPLLLSPFGYSTYRGS